MRMTSRSRPPHGERAHHRPREGQREIVERGLRAERAHRLLLGGQVTVERILDRSVAERLQRAEVVAHRRDIGLGGTRQLAESDAILAAFREQVQRSVQEARPCAQTGLATLVRSRRFHIDY